MAEHILKENTTAPSTPNSGYLALYAMDDSNLYIKNDAGTETLIGGEGITNLLINGSFAVAQRGTQTTLSEYSYTTCDRWYALTQTAAINTSQVSGDEQRYALRLTQPNATAQRIGAVQIVEGVNSRHMRGKSATLSGRVKLSASGNVRFAILSWTGTEDGTGASDPAPNFDNTDKELVNDWTSATYTASNFFVATSLVVEAVGSVTCDGTNFADFGLTSDSAISASMNNLIVFVWSEATLAQNATLDLEAVQLEAGESASIFQQRGGGEELALCQRYYHQIGGMANYQYGIGFANSATDAYVPIRMVGTMRTTPACSFSALADFVLLGFGNSSIAPAAMSFGVVSPLDLRIDITSTSMTSLAGGILQGSATTANTMIFNAEL